MNKKVLAGGAAALGLAASIFAVSPAWANETAGSASTYETPAGQSVTFTVTNTDALEFDWCAGLTGSGFGMAILFTANVGGEDFAVPAGSDVPGVPANGNFTWNATELETVSATITIPADAVPGTYEVFLGCVTSSPDYLHPGDGTIIDTFVITAPTPTPDPELATTGADMTTPLVGAGIAGIALVAGFGAIGLRRRAAAKK